MHGSVIETAKRTWHLRWRSARCELRSGRGRQTPSRLCNGVSDAICRRLPIRDPRSIAKGAAEVLSHPHDALHRLRCPRRRRDVDVLERDRPMDGVVRYRRRRRRECPPGRANTRLANGISWLLLVVASRPSAVPSRAAAMVEASFKEQSATKTKRGSNFPAAGGPPARFDGCYANRSIWSAAFRTSRCAFEVKSRPAGCVCLIAKSPRPRVMGLQRLHG